MKLSVKTSLLLLFFFFFSGKVIGTHIVGGEFEMVHHKGFNYTFNLILYFDDINGNPAILQQENSLTAFIYRKSDNALIRSVTLNKIRTTFVPYTNIDCTIESLRTRRLVYTTTTYLSPQRFNDPEGYYIVWERCCRNNTIDNVVLVAPNTVGQTYYLEFPPVVDLQGNPFVNSSPVLFPPLSDYACAGQFYYADFAGSDADGDSIVYSMVSPLNSSTIEPTPTPTPVPHQDVPWISGVGIGNQIPGHPPLNISSIGLLTVTPSSAGLFVFGVKAEEFRNGKKIGEVRRDFQMLVIDCPVPGSAPEIFARIKGQTEFYKDGSMITFTSDDQPKCIDLFVKDADAPEALTLRAIPVNFSADVSGILSLNGGFVVNKNDTLKADVCFPDCPYTINQPMYIDLVAYDDACSLPLSDTVRIGVVIQPPPNNGPEIVNPASETIVRQVKDGETFSLPIKGIDADGDVMSIEAVLRDGLDMASVGMRLKTTRSVPGELEAEFVWETGCEIYDFTKQSTFDLWVLVDDLDECRLGNADTLNLSLSVQLPPNNDPVVSADLPNLTFFAEIGETLDFTVFADDIDKDYVTLRVEPAGFPLDFYKINFEAVEGIASVSSPFRWELDCELIDLEFKHEFNFLFIATDRDKCRIPNADTLNVNIIVLPPKNQEPEISLSEIIEQPKVFTVGDKVKFNVIGTDPDNDSVFVDLLDREKYEGMNYIFEPVRGVGKVSSLFTWIPACSDITTSPEPPSINRQSGDFITFSFVVWDNYCIRPQYDTITLKMAIEDIIVDNTDFLPPNVFTPNKDGYNDYFTIPDLPEDNCANQFVEIVIYNRHGKLVFKDKERTFKWDGDGAAAGIYYYFLKFTNEEYNGTISVLY
ncbi:MAG: gliding motility-associated C-terminal domain-containing protein [Cytophagales bacterium]|nr:gliding motility-associated C-terminal domain-containing protein [Cytophagales bacterium]